MAEILQDRFESEALESLPFEELDDGFDSKLSENNDCDKWVGIYVHSIYLENE